MIKLLSRFSFLLAFTVILLGAFTRLSDAGLGCPDWPGCYGQILAPINSDSIQQAEQVFPGAPVDVSKAWTEMIHRYFASLLGLLIVGIALLSTFKSRQVPATAKPWLPWLLVGLVIFQGLLGMWTVTLRLLPVVVMGHLIGGLTTLSLLWILILQSSSPQSPPKPALHSRLPIYRSLTLVAGLSLVIICLQIMLGGWTSANYAALACPDFPHCLGRWLPEVLNFSQAFDPIRGIGAAFPTLAIDNEARITIHLMHRIGALLTTIILIFLSILLIKNKIFNRLAMILILLLTVQVSLGIANVVAKLPLMVAVAHNGVAALLLLTVITLNYKLVNATVAE